MYINPNKILYEVEVWIGRVGTKISTSNESDLLFFIDGHTMRSAASDRKDYTLDNFSIHGVDRDEFPSTRWRQYELVWTIRVWQYLGGHKEGMQFLIVFIMPHIVTKGRNIGRLSDRSFL